VEAGQIAAPGGLPGQEAEGGDFYRIMTGFVHKRAFDNDYSMFPVFRLRFFLIYPFFQKEENDFIIGDKVGAAFVNLFNSLVLLFKYSS
jgi:hypothetical protein